MPRAPGWSRRPPWFCSCPIPEPASAPSWRGPCGGRAIDPAASAASAIVVSQGLAAARPPITAGQEPLDTRPTPPSPGQDLPGGHQDPQDGTEVLGGTTGHVGCWPTSWESATARSRGCGPSTTSNPGRRGLRVLDRPPRGWRPESATWSCCPWSRRPHAIVLCGREVADPGAGAHLAFPPRRCCPPATSARSSDSPGG
jgi:hypothetical protein